MLTSKFLKDIMSEAFPVIKRQVEDAKIIAGFRDVVAANGGDWAALKALMKAHVEDQIDEASDGKRVRKIVDKGENSIAYADMLGLNMNEQNYSGHDADGVFHDDETTEPQPETAVQMQTGRNQSKASPDRAESIVDGRSISVANTLGNAGFIDPIGYETETNSQSTPSVATGEHVPPLTVLSRTHTLETANENADVRAHDAPHVEDDSAAVAGAPLTSDSQANTGGQNEDPSRTEHVTLDRRPGPTAPDEGQNGSEHQRAEHSETYTAPVGRAADESPTPFYAEPGEVVMETCPPVGIVVHPYAACWPVNTVDVGDGILEPVVKIGHMILDGRGRYYAARQANVEYPVVQYDGDDDLADSINWNLASRPSTDQRALRIVAEKLAKLVPDRAEEIMERFGFNEAQKAAQ